MGRLGQAGDNLTGRPVFLAPKTALAWERQMALSIVAHPVTTLQASAVSETQQTPLALLWRVTPSGAERPGVACGLVLGSSRPSAFGTACRILLPWLDPCEGARLNTNIIVLITALELKAYRTVHAASFYAKDCCRVLYVPQFQDNTVANT